MRKTLFVLLAIGLATAVAAFSWSPRAAFVASPSTIAGSVAGGGKITVRIRKTERSATTDKTGFFVFKDKRLSGSHTLVFIKNGKRYTTQVNVPAGLEGFASRV